MFRHLLPLTALLAAASAMAEPCSAPKGAQLFQRQCAMCHVAEAGAAHSVGPNLHGAAGRAIGQAPGFAYSEVLAEAAGTWDEARLGAFLAAPQKAFPGTAMPFQGLRSEADRRHLICYLQTLK